MSKSIDQQLIAGFVGEAKSYIPNIESAIESLRGGVDRISKIEEMHRYIQNIKGASSMIGVTELSDISNYMEKLLEDLAANKVEYSDEVLLFLRNTTTHIGKYLDSLVDGEFDYKSVVNEVKAAYIKLGGKEAQTEKVEFDKEQTIAPEDSTYTESTSESTADTQYPENEPLIAGPLSIYKELLNKFGELQDAPESYEKINELKKLVSELKDNCNVSEFLPADKVSAAINFVSDISSNLLKIVNDIDAHKVTGNYETLLGIAETFIYQIERVLYNYRSEIDFESEVGQLFSNYEEFHDKVLAGEQNDLQNVDADSADNKDGAMSPELIDGFISETKKDINAVINEIENYAVSTDKKSIINSVKSHIHKIHGASGMLGFDNPQNANNERNHHGIFLISKELSEFLNLVSDSDTELDAQSAGVVVQGTLLLKKLCEDSQVQNVEEEISNISSVVSQLSSNILQSPQVNVEQDAVSLDPPAVQERKPQKQIIPDELFEVFTIEANEHLENMNKCLSVYKSTNDLQDLQEVRRGAHTIKGAAGMVGLQSVSDLGHEMESVLDNIFERNIQPSKKVLDLFSITTTFLEKLISNGDNVGTDSELNDILSHYSNIDLFDELSYEQATAAIDTEEISIPDDIPQVEIEHERQDAEKVVSEVSTEQPQFMFYSESTEDIPPDLLEVFLIEANEHLQNMGRYLNMLVEDNKDRDSLQEIRRSVHTIKGAAGMVGFSSVSTLAHRMEDLLDNLYENSVVLNDEIINLLYRTSDLLDDIVNSKVTDLQGNKLLTSLYDEYKAFVKEDDSEKIPAEQVFADTPDQFIQDDVFLGLNTEEIFNVEEVQQEPHQRQEQAIRKPGDFVRIPMERLDELVNLVSELVVNRSTFEQHFGVFNQELDEMALSLDRLRRVTSNLETQYEVLTLGGGKLQMAAGDESNVSSLPVHTSQTHGFDELEFDRYTEFHQYTRELSESTSDIRAIGGQMAGLTGDFESYLNRQERITSEVQDKLMRLRMVPLATVATRLHRAVRVTASQQNKKVQLNIVGEDVELDKTVLEEMSDPLLHIIRNSVDHGIELAELRKALGKDEVGTITLKAYYEGTQVVIQIGDDGAGLVPEVLRTAAVRGGFISESDSHRISDEELFKLIFLPGFTSTTEISEISGRGVGMDIVGDTVTKLKGTVSIDSEASKGVTFTIRLPMTLAITRVLLVYANNEQFAVPLASVSQIMRVEKEYIENLGDERVLKIENNIYPIIRLGEALNLKTSSSESITSLPVLIMNLGEQHIALVVDELLESREVVVKTLGNHLKNVHGITGATLMGDGSVVLIVNPSDLIDKPSSATVDINVPVSTEFRRDILDVFIVDDSLSVRRIMTNLIKNSGWNPIVAKDGVEALEILQRSVKLPDVILLDIEMPRMDGYELTSTLRAQQQFKDIPIVMITSRAGKKHRDEAFELGANDYMVKPYQEEDLIGLIKKITGSTSNTSLQ